MNSARGSQTRGFIPKRLILLAASAVLLGSSFVILPVTAIAQTLMAQSRVIRATSGQDETLFLNNDRTYSYELRTASASSIGGITVPAGARIQGRFVPADGGLRYIADAVSFSGRFYRVSATSEVLEDEKDPRDTSAAAIAEDAGIGAAGGAVLGEIFGNADLGEIAGGAAAGVIVGNVTADRVVVIEPDRVIPLY